MTRAALWLRVSTADQDPANQRPSLEGLAERRGWQVVRVYELSGESAFSGGGAGYRRAVAAMVAEARAGTFEVLAAWSLDRLTRGGPLDALRLLDQLGRVGVQVATVQEPWLEAGPEFRDVLVALVGWVALWESERRSERTKAGLERARAAGVRLGRPPGARDRRKRRRSGYLLRQARLRGG
ncbi:MAG: recombinase family protein [Candidatus Dormibacteria bacterium]